ncbi:hypothetical protein GCM10023194_07790 [Planotetraspora phitsanulokensis]
MAGWSSGRDSAGTKTSNSVVTLLSSNAINASAFRTRNDRSSPSTFGRAYASSHARNRAPASRGNRNSPSTPPDPIGRTRKNRRPWSASDSFSAHPGSKISRKNRPARATSAGPASSANPTKIGSATPTCSSVNPLTAAQIAATSPSDNDPSANRAATTGNRTNSTANPSTRPAEPPSNPPRNHDRVLACPCTLASPARCTRPTRAAIAATNRSRAPTNTSTSATHSAADSGTPPTTNPDTAASTATTNPHDDTPDSGGVRSRASVPPS